MAREHVRSDRKSSQMVLLFRSSAYWQARRPRILDDALAEADGVSPDCRLVKRDRRKYKLRQVTTGYGEGSSKAFDFQAG